MGYSTETIRNIALLGHSGAGKTSLNESILYLTGKLDRAGTINAGNTVSDSDAEEIKRKISISLSTSYTDYRDTRINIQDTPGFFDFTGEVQSALRVVGGGVIVTGAKDGITVGFEKAWQYLTEKRLARAIFISKIDEENSDYDTAFAAIREQLGTSVCPMIFPIKDEKGKIVGLVDLIRRVSYSYEGGRRHEHEIPAELEASLAPLYAAVNEAVAETDDDLMEKFFSGEEFTLEERVRGLRKGVRELSVTPVFCGDVLAGLGVLLLLDGVVNLFPSPAEGAVETTLVGNDVPCDAAGTAAVIVYKTIADQYGKYSLFGVISGEITSETQVENARTGAPVRLGRIYKMQGKKTVEVDKLTAGDVGAASKLDDVKTGDTLRAVGSSVVLRGVEYTAPCYSVAIAPKTKGQEDKIAAGLTRLAEEDPTFTLANNNETHQMVLSGAGDIQLDVLVAKLKDRFAVESVLIPAKVPYRETIRKKVTVRGRHKKQSGGHGQFGDVVIDFEPGQTEELTFTESVFGGAVPKNYFPAVEKGLQDSIKKGVLAGYPVVFLKATLTDGSYHPVDSSEMAFKMAASIAYKEGIPTASPAILEPVGHLTVTIPDRFLGDIMSDLSKRRGSPLGMSASGSTQIVEAEVPLGEMGSYAIDLRSMTQGRGSFALTFLRYEEAPMAVQQKIIEEAKKDAE
ncbi:MAG: elongation factor G [Oscillospiraceae bacterium]|jgi:elongation factor G|nr:elongation factor G [Oscillospiraceae bacterium]